MTEEIDLPPNAEIDDKDAEWSDKYLPEFEAELVARVEAES